MYRSPTRRWVDPRCTVLDLPEGIIGPFVELDDGGLLTVKDGAVRRSHDDGKSWSAPEPIHDGRGPGVPSSGLLLRTQRGVIVLVYVDNSNFYWFWDDSTRRPAENVRSNVWTVRSEDEGRTWTDRQMIMEGFNGALITMIETCSGKIVVPVQKLWYNPGRHVTPTYVSGDDGKTWKVSNVIDLGGDGHHDGSYESTLVELRDGRLWMLIRTNWDYFWEAISEDDGLHWLEFRPTTIDASSSPGYVTRLASGRLFLAWNRLYPEGESYGPRRAWHYSDVPASWQRQELAVAFSDDDGKTWTDSEVIARDPYRLSYMGVFERRPGEIWVSAGQGKFLGSIREQDFV